MDHVVLHTELGDSIGHYEGDTLIVHTVNFRPEHSYYAMPISKVSS